MCVCVYIYIYIYIYIPRARIGRGRMGSKWASSMENTCGLCVINDIELLSICFRTICIYLPSLQDYRHILLCCLVKCCFRVWIYIYTYIYIYIERERDLSLSLYIYIEREREREIEIEIERERERDRERYDYVQYTVISYTAMQTTYTRRCPCSGSNNGRLVHCALSLVLLWPCILCYS